MFGALDYFSSDSLGFGELSTKSLFAAPLWLDANLANGEMKDSLYDGVLARLFSGAHYTANEDGNTAPFDLWFYDQVFAFYERLNKVFYEGWYRLPIEVRSAPDTSINAIEYGSQHLFMTVNNPMMLTSSIRECDYARFSDFYNDLAAPIDHLLVRAGGRLIFEPHAPFTDVDASSQFYRSRAFISLLEVDNPLILPYGTNIRLSITSDDVIHSWAVPSFGIKIDAIPGRVNQTALVILHPGVFMGQCSELCGILHSFMPINIEAINPDVFFEEYNFTLKSRADEE